MLETQRQNIENFAYSIKDIGAIIPNTLRNSRNSRFILPVLALAVAIAFPGTDSTVHANESMVPSPATGVKVECDMRNIFIFPDTANLSWDRNPSVTSSFVRIRRSNGTWWPDRNNAQEVSLSETTANNMAVIIGFAKHAIVGVYDCNKYGCGNFSSIEVTCGFMNGGMPSWPTRTP